VWRVTCEVVLLSNERLPLQVLLKLGHLSLQRSEPLLQRCVQCIVLLTCCAAHTRAVAVVQQCSGREEVDKRRAVCALLDSEQKDTSRQGRSPRLNRTADAGYRYRQAALLLPNATTLHAHTV
jgi:hypothetical protein